MTQLLAVPKQGLTPRDPRTMLIVPPEGVLVPEHDPYWQDLARFGDVELREAEESGEAQAKAPEPPTPAPAEFKKIQVTDDVQSLTTRLAEPTSAPPALAE